MRRLLGIIAVAGLVASASYVAAQTTVKYKYDDFGRLTAATTSSAGSTFSASYAYDNADNRTSATVTSSSAGPIVCSNFTYYTGINPLAGPTTVSIPAGVMISNCTNPGTPTVTTPATPLSVTIAAHQNLPYSFTVSNGSGGTSSAIMTVNRP